jgi:hypothetical protein
MFTRFGYVWRAGAIALLLAPAPAGATDLNVVSGPRMAQVLNDLRPRIEGLTNRNLVVSVMAPEALKRRLSGSDPFDAAVVSEPDAVTLLESKRIVVDRLSCIGWARQGQQLTPIYAAVSSTAKERDAAQRLLAFLSSFEAMAAITALQLEGTPYE